MRLIAAAAIATAATVLVATPALAGPAPHSRTTTIEQPATAGVAETESFVLSTGLTEGQLIGHTPKIRPVYAAGVTVTKVEVLLDGTTLADMPSTSRPDLVIFYMPGRRFHEKEVVVTLRAYDADGDIGEASTRVRNDIISPTTWVQPAAGAIIGGTTRVQFTSRDGDLARVEIQDVAGNTLAKTTQAPWVLDWDTRPFNGYTTVRLIIRDGADNDWDSTRQYYIDNVGPHIGKIYPAAGTLIRGSAVTTADASDPSGLITVSVKDGQPTDNPMQWIVNPTEQGPYAIVWTIADRHGYSTTAEQVVINDTVGADLQITEAPEDGSTLTGPVRIGAEASDLNGVDRVELLVDGAVAAADPESAYEFTLNPADHAETFTVALRAHDRAGNVTTSRELTYHH